VKDYRFLGMSIVLFLMGGYVIRNPERVKALNKAIGHFSGRWPTWMAVALGVTLLLFGALTGWLSFIEPYRP
jgi:hypothetical protein